MVEKTDRELAVRDLRQVGSGMTDYGCGRCDCHHEMVDFRLRKKPRSSSGATRRPNLRLTLTNARTRSGSFSSLPCPRSNRRAWLAAPNLAELEVAVSNLNKKIPVSPMRSARRLGVNFVLLLGPLRSSGRRALSRSTAPSARRLLRGHGRLENDPDRVRALVSVSRRFGRRVAPELERGFFLSLKSTIS